MQIYNNNIDIIIVIISTSNSKNFISKQNMYIRKLFFFFKNVYDQNMKCVKKYILKYRFMNKNF